MATIIPVKKPISQMQLAPGSLVTISEVTREEFEAILQELGEKRAARIAYSNQTLEIMVPLPEHEKPNDLISDIVKLLLKRSGRKYEPFGSTTFKQPGTAGIEPDDCFYSGSHWSEVRGGGVPPPRRGSAPAPQYSIDMKTAIYSELSADD